jgi:unsaturated rhamnogalacturonyl hydrolase
VNRRTFIGCTGLAVATGWSVLRSGRAASPSCAQHHVAKVVSAPAIPFPAGKREPFGWKTATIADAAQPPVLLAWPELPADAQPTQFRLAVGLDERDEKTVEVFLPMSGRVLGTMDLRFVSQFQIYQLSLPALAADAVRCEGLGLRLTRGSEFEVFTQGENLPAELSPHLLVPGTTDVTAEYFARMQSLACVQQFGWMEGCVLDGLLDLAALPAHAALRATAQQHLDLFFRGGRLVYENHLSVPSDGKIYGIEGGLPFAALARTDPKSPLLDLAVNFWRSRRRPSGAIQDGVHLSSEGAYTVGYALAEIGRAQKSEELIEIALQQVRIRQEALFDGTEFWRTRNDNGVRGNRNWARGIAWQILGLARTLVVAKDRRDVADLVAALQRFSDWAIRLQRPDGLWSVFADEPELTPDTGGSTGIAAALAIGVKHGWLGPEAAAAAKRTLAGLRAHLTPDGFLGGVSQSNKGGEGLQRSSYRSIYQMAMGLKGQLIAALASPQSRAFSR